MILGCGEPEGAKRGDRIMSRTIRRAKRNVRNYSLYQRGKKVYNGISNNPWRRLREHRKNGIRATLKVEPTPRTRQSARQRERRLNIGYRRRKGFLPKHNKIV